MGRMDACVTSLASTLREDQAGAETRPQGCAHCNVQRGGERSSDVILREDAKEPEM